MEGGGGMILDAAERLRVASALATSLSSLLSEMSMAETPTDEEWEGVIELAGSTYRKLGPFIEEMSAK